MTQARHPVVRHRARTLARYRDLRSECGSAVVELALICAFFAPPLLLGTGQMGILVYDSIEVANSAGAGATYGMKSATYAANSYGIVTAAQTEATDFGAALGVTPSTYYACANALGGKQYTGSNAQSNANAGCTGAGNHALEFVNVATSATVTPSIHCPGLPTSYTLAGAAVMEVQQ